MEYTDIIHLFLKDFSTYWNQMLSDINSNQIQLAQGNRLRPQNCLWGFLSTFEDKKNIKESDISEIAYISVSIEMIHKSSLLIDDWIDGDSVRHGSIAFHVEYSPQEAVLMALNMIGYAMIRLQNSFRSNNFILPQHYFMYFDSLLNTIYGMAKGALQELQLKGNDFFDEEKIKNIIQLETSEILANCMLLGYYAGLGEREIIPEIESGFKKIGDYCGFLFQVMNDMEAYNSPDKLFKHKGNLNLDVLKHRKNYGVAILYNIANKKDKTIIEQAKTEDILFSLFEKYHIKDIISLQIQRTYTQIKVVSSEL